ncbi:hypothetical protein [Xylella fastidiosa]|uniref:hypothetical protein n=1 Tax=Xylella fastidiosa TaxID=2371 RepID=UPI001E635E98|nr:hypothetical protein [Xylella fastidiosa]
MRCLIAYFSAPQVALPLSGITARTATAAGHIGADAGAAAGHPDLGTQAGAAVALAGGLFLGALGAVGV